MRSARLAQIAASQSNDEDVGDVTMLLDPPPYIVTQTDGASLTDSNQPSRPGVSPFSTSNPVPIPASASQRAASGPMTIPNVDGQRDRRTPSPTGAPVVLNGGEGPITPRNDAGPWVFDGSGLRMRADGVAAGSEGAGGSRINSIEAAVVNDVPMA